jgi:hypothetical protein
MPVRKRMKVFIHVRPACNPCDARSSPIGDVRFGYQNDLGGLGEHDVRPRQEYFLRRGEKTFRVRLLVSSWGRLLGRVDPSSQRGRGSRHYSQPYSYQLAGDPH